jgi:cellulose biosynthesis protein BcsQ
MIVSVANNKGGTGKTHWAVALLWYLSMNASDATKERIVACDFDQAQLCLSSVLSTNKKWLHIPMIEPTFAAMAAANDEGKIVIADTPPLTFKYKELVEASNTVVIPVFPDQHGVLGFQRLMSFAGDTKKIRPFINMWRDTSYKQQCAEYLANAFPEYRWLKVPNMEKVSKNIFNGDENKDLFYMLTEAEREIMTTTLNYLIGAEQ